MSEVTAWLLKWYMIGCSNDCVFRYIWVVSGVVNGNEGWAGNRGCIQKEIYEDEFLYFESVLDSFRIDEIFLPSSFNSIFNARLVSSELMESK